MLEPEPGSRSSINHCDHTCQRCSEKHIANMARVGVLLPMGECHTQTRERGRPYAGLDVVGGDVDGRIHTDGYPTGHPELRQPGEELPLNQVSCELDPRPPKVTALQGGRRLELARWSSGDVLLHLQCWTRPSPSRVLSTAHTSAWPENLSLAHTASCLTLAAGSYCRLPRTAGREALAILTRGQGASRQRRGEAGRPADTLTRRADQQTRRTH